VRWATVFQRGHATSRDLELHKMASKWVPLVAEAHLATVLYRRALVL
jgi:hypothetical protein